jgi:hypothetical protein
LVAGEAVVRALESLGRVLASIVLVASVAVVSAEATTSGPVIDCPFSLLPGLHLHPGDFRILCEIFGEEQAAN